MVSSEVSIGSLNRMSNERTAKRRAPSATLVDTTVGAKVSRTTWKVCRGERPTLPPVSVARSCTVTVLPPMAMAGMAANSSNGKSGSLETTWPLTSSSTRATCVSSLTVGTMRRVWPSCTWTPSVLGSASITLTAMLTVGATPARSALL